MIADLEPHFSELSFGSWIRIKTIIQKAMKAQNGATDAHKGRRGGSKCSPGGYVDQWTHIRITLMMSRIRIRIKVRGRIRICIEVKKLDPDPHSSEKLDPDPHLSEKLNPDPN
jgi:hypothetical protein